METDRITTEFIARTLPKAQWTHQAHLRAGLWHALHHSDDVSLDLLRERIRAYNESTGGVNTSNAGYHETITRFYVGIIRLFLNSVDAGRSIDELAQELIARFGDKDLPLYYYSRERLYSTEARMGWLAPDLKPLAPVNLDAGESAATT
jgi:hypothetical protein